MTDPEVELLIQKEISQITKEISSLKEFAREEARKARNIGLTVLGIFMAFGGLITFVNFNDTIQNIVAEQIAEVGEVQIKDMLKRSEDTSEEILIIKNDMENLLETYQEKLGSLEEIFVLHATLSEEVERLNTVLTEEHDIFRDDIKTMDNTAVKLGDTVSIKNSRYNNCMDHKKENGDKSKRVNLTNCRSSSYLTQSWIFEKR